MAEDEFGLNEIQKSNHDDELFGLSSSSASLTAFVNFISGEAEEAIPVSLYFTYYQSIPSYLNFLAPGSQSLLVSVSIGTHIKSLPVSVSFNAAASTDFHSQINIQSLNISQPGNYAGANSFKATMQIQALGNASIPFSVNFRQPPISEDIIVYLNFANQFSINAIDIYDNYYPAIIDNTGYFHIDNLPAGTYTVIPSYVGINFSPYEIETNVGNNNSLIYFYVNGNFSLANLNLSPIVSGCHINDNIGDAGTFTIEGFILNYSNSYQPILSIISDTSIANSYKQTL